jgi:hypothetical protein
MNRKSKVNETFAERYVRYCKLHHTSVLTHVINHEDQVLFLEVQRIKKEEDWDPIIKSLRKDKLLQKITLFVQHLDGNINQSISTKSLKKDFTELMRFIVF